MLFKKRNIILFCCIIICSIWGYLVYDVNKRFPEPKNYVGQLNETIDYYGLSAVLKNVYYYEFDELLKIYPELKNDLNRTWGEDLSYFYDSTYVLVELYLKNSAKNLVNLGDLEKTPERMTLELGAYSNGCASFIYSCINKEVNNIFEQNTERVVYLPFSIYKQYMDMEEIKTYDVKICYQFYPEKRYFYYRPNAVQE